MCACIDIYTVAKTGFSHAHTYIQRLHAIVVPKHTTVLPKYFLFHLARRKKEQV